MGSGRRTSRTGGPFPTTPFTWAWRMPSRGICWWRGPAPLETAVNNCTLLSWDASGAALVNLLLQSSRDPAYISTLSCVSSVLRLGTRARRNETDRT
jgi:hypothetical protein